jgi:hypothetical protein
LTALAGLRTLKHPSVSLKTVRPQTLALWLAGGVPFVAYVATASGFAYWLDSGEFVAAAVQLDIAHPPGHPLSALYGAAFGLLPLGSLSFRVAVGQALASALASALHCRATVAALSGMELPTKVVWPLGVFAAWLSALTYGIWFQAVRPEVYALQTLCVAVVFERLVALAMQPATGDTRPLLGAAVGLSLGLTNHHLIALLLVPAFLPALWQVWRGRRLRTLSAACALGAVGLGTYLYLPLRAAANPPANLGNPVNLERFLWVVSAQVYAHDMGTEEPQPLLERCLDVLLLLFENFRALPTLLALIGLYVLARHAGTRRHALLCALLFAVDAGARAWLGPVRSNPDILGYLAPSFLVTGTLAAGCLGAVFWLFARHRPASAAKLSGYAVLLPLCALALIPRGQARASLRHFEASDAFDELRMRRLPARAVVVASMPQTVFRSWEVAAVERARPDLVTIPLPFLRYPGTSEALLQRHPELSAMVHSYLSSHDRLQAEALSQLARTRPVFVELDTRIAPNIYPLLRSHGLLAQVSTDAEHVSADDLRNKLDSTYAELYQLLGPDLRETETARQLLWIHYMNAVQLAGLGARELAQREAARALAIHPADARARELARALREPGPLKVERFLQF